MLGYNRWLPWILALSMWAPTTAGAFQRQPREADLLSALSRGAKDLAETARARGPRDPETLRATLRLAELNRLANRPGPAALLLTRCRQLAEEILPSTDLLWVEQCLQEIRVLKNLAAQGDRDRARVLRDRAQAILDANPAADLQADLWLAWGNHLRSEERVAEAIPFYERALELRRNTHPQPTLAEVDNLTWLAWVCFVAGDNESSQEHFAEAERILDELGLSDHPLRCTIDGNLAQFLNNEGDAKAAIERLERAIDHCATARRGLPVGDPRRGYMVQSHYTRLAFLHAQQGNEERSWELMRHGLGADLTGHLELARYSARHQQPRVRLESNTGALRPAEITALQEELAYLQEQRRLVDEETPEQSWPLERVQAAMAPDTALVAWIDVPGTTWEARAAAPWAYVVTASAPPAWVPLSLGRSPKQVRLFQDAAARVVRRTRMASVWHLRVDPDPSLLEDARAAGTLFWEPLVSLLSETQHLVLLPPSGRLHAELFRFEDTWLTDRYRVSYAPSPVAYARWQESAASEDDDRALLIGQTDGADILRRKPLPGATAEIAEIAERFPEAVVLRGSAASLSAINELALSDSLRSYSVIHVATHAAADSRIPDRSWLALADGQLRAAAVLSGWSLDATLVTLSACRTLSAPYSVGDYTGFAQYFLAAGARCVLMSRWNVGDEPTRLLMTRFYANWLEHDMTRTSALHEAQRWVRHWRNKDGTTPWAHPVYWAGFILYGAPH